MADGTVINQGSGGDTIATDDIAGTKWQMNKMVFGALNTATLVSLTDGMPIQNETGGNIVVTNAGTFVTQATLQTGANAIGKLAANNGIDIGDVTINGPIGPGVEAGAILVTLATDSTGVISVDDNGAALTVDNAGTFAVQSTLQAGANAIGKLAENSGVDIGDVTINGPVGGGVEAGAILVTIASNSTGVLSIDDNGGTLTVDNNGTFATQATLQAGTAAIGKLTANEGIDIGDVTINGPLGGGVEAGALLVTIASDSTGVISIDDNGAAITVDNAGTFAVQAAGAVAHGAADSGNPLKIGAKAVSAEPAVVDTGDRANLISDLVGKLITLPYTLPETMVADYMTDAAGASVEVIAAGASGVRTFITTIVLDNLHATTNAHVQIKDGATVKMVIPVPANGGAVVNLPVPLRGTAATAWNFHPTAAVTTITCSMAGYQGV